LRPPKPAARFSHYPKGNHLHPPRIERQGKMTARHSKIRVTDWRQNIIHGVELTLVLLCLALLIPFGGTHPTVTAADITQKTQKAATITRAPARPLTQMITRAVVAVRRTLPTRYTVRAGDTLTGIARRLYGTANDWGYLYHVNDRLIVNANLIYVGQTLIIPPAMPKGYSLAEFLPRQPAPRQHAVVVAGSAAQPLARPSSATVPGGRLSCSGLEQLWDSAGGNPDDAFMAAEIAMAESGGDQYATDHDSNGTTDEGLWQVNSSNGALATYDAYGNARSAITLSDDGESWSAWVTDQTGAYEGLC